ncbi:cytochrome b/b6 domain-containing protein [candidate division KSB1 bacterium]
MKKVTILSVLICVTIFGLNSCVFSQSDEECLECHLEIELEYKNAAGETVSAVFDSTAYKNCLHFDMGFECIDCHSSIEELPHEDELDDVDCGQCHDDISEAFNESLHSYALERGNEQAPNCADCHGKHGILPHDNELSPSNPQNVADMCNVCHGEYGIKSDEELHGVKTVEIYLESVHGKNVEEGNAEAAKCTDCHGIHDIKGRIDIESKVNRRNIPETCSQCHPAAYEDYIESIHGKALIAGIPDSPICTDCHGEHNIQSHLDPVSPTSQIRLSQEICAECHEDPKIISKYGLPSETFTTYRDSYHGLVTRQGFEFAATCVSCHGVHKILPLVNAESTVHPENVVETCGQCHPEADTRFAASYTHSMQREDTNPVDHFVRLFYISMITIILTFMVIHHLIIIIRHLVEKYEYEKNIPRVQRFNKVQITQHAVVALSFIILVITGFALRFPNSFWVEFLESAGLDEINRGNIHRIAAVVMIVFSFYHIGYILFSKTGRYEFIKLLPSRRDLTEMKQNFLFNTGRSDLAPQFDKYDYTEKIEYWALVWGSIVMVVTGFILWFPVAFINFLPQWSIKVAETIHYFEAWLAFLAIIIWHFFFVFFYPGEYPLSLVMFTGKMTRDEARHRHPAWKFEIIKFKKTDNTPKPNKE